MIRPFCLSVAVPVDNEEEVVPELLRRLYPVPFGSSVMMFARKIPSLSAAWDETLKPQQLRMGTRRSGLSRACMKCERGFFVKNKFQIKPCGQCRAIGHAVREAHFAGHWFRG